jgi:hypothetical protein
MRLVARSPSKGCQAPVPHRFRRLHRGKAPRVDSKQRKEFDARQTQANWAGVDLTRINGLGLAAVMKVLTEIGPDLSRFANVKHFCSWSGLCPGTKISGGKVLSAKTKRSANRARRQVQARANGVLHAHPRRRKDTLWLAVLEAERPERDAAATQSAMRFGTVFFQPPHVCRLAARVSERRTRQSRCGGRPRPIRQLDAASRPRLERFAQQHGLRSQGQRGISNGRPRRQLLERRVSVHVAIRLTPGRTTARPGEVRHYGTPTLRRALAGLVDFERMPAGRTRDSGTSGRSLRRPMVLSREDVWRSCPSPSA